jgi:glycosyltransferase involved in cell wall biosynthesis
LQDDPLLNASAPFVSVVIPHYNDIEQLAHCLEGLHRQSFPRDRFVADNNSIGGMAAVERIAPDVVVSPALEQGAGPARNAGAAAARGTHPAFIDSDCIADENWLQSCHQGRQRGQPV